MSEVEKTLILLVWRTQKKQEAQQICVCVCVFVHFFVYLYVSVCACVCGNCFGCGVGLCGMVWISVCICLYVFICICVYMFVCVRVCVRVRVCLASHRSSASFCRLEANRTFPVCPHFLFVLSAHLCSVFGLLCVLFFSQCISSIMSACCCCDGHFQEECCISRRLQHVGSSFHTVGVVLIKDRNQ